ncbi:hypothetical protein WJX77_004124 [Trebouxia sp. C0004]
MPHSSFAHVGGTLNNIDPLPGLHDKSRHELDSWAAADKENRRLVSDRRGADHGDSLPNTPVSKRRRRRNWESPASFEHEDAYDIETDPFESTVTNRGRQQRVICSFRIHDGNKAIRQALMTCICTCGETYEWIRRLGLPMNSIRNKLPYHRDAMRNIKVVVTSPRLQRLVEASKSGDLYSTEIPERPKPVFRTSAPGVGTVLASNLALIWVLMTARV